MHLLLNSFLLLMNFPHQKTWLVTGSLCYFNVHVTQIKWSTLVKGYYENQFPLNIPNIMLLYGSVNFLRDSCHFLWNMSLSKLVTFKCCIVASYCETILLLFCQHNSLHRFTIYYVIITTCFGLIGQPQVYKIQK
jgi:hypothetical protein